MNYAEYNRIRTQVLEYFNTGNEYNSDNSVRRFYPMIRYNDGKMVSYGMYDYQTKKYVLFDIYAQDQNSQLNEFKEFLATNTAIPAVR